LPLTEIGYLGGRCQQHDAGKSGGWQSTGSLITDEDARTFDATTGVATSFDWVDYNFKGFMTEFRIWKNKRVSDVGYHVRNTTSPSNIPSPYSSKRLKGNEDGLVAYYPMNEGVGDILYDLTMENNIPARLIKTPKTKRFYPEDANADAVNNIRWNQPPDGLRFLEPDDTQSLFIKQNRVHPVLSFNPSNKQYDSDIVTFGEIYDTVQDVGITNFSFTDSKNQRLAPQIGDYLLMKWNVDPSCLKRDMLQTMTNIVTISLPYYREPYPIVLDMFYESEEVPDEPPAPTGPDDTQENWIASLFAGPEPSNWLSKDHSSGVRFTYDTVSVDYEAYLGFNSYRYNDATNEAFENIFTPKSAHSNLAMKDFDYEDYYFILHISYGNNRRKSYHSKNAIPFVLNDVIRDDYTKPIWGMLGDSSNVPIQRSQEDIKQSMVAHILEPSFGGQGTVNDPHVLTLKIPYDDSSNRIQSTLKTARLEVYNKFTTLTKSGELVSNTPKVAFGPTPYGELAFFKREN
jgi:hypothetical protein